ncbi:MAG TPA: DUF5662 family protein [Chthoniobacterales bacterium]|nr:DUF5662 family protein [Chthoniobacterales bacterium]
MDYDSTIDTTLHINRVRFLLGQCAIRLLERGSKHDASKLEQPEKAIFDAVGNRLAVITYQGEEYKQSLAELKVALDHHYLYNTHHPDHYLNGIDGMSLFDLVEMLMDWKAAGERHPNGMNIARSIELSSQRFSVGGQLKQILLNTAKEIGWI